MPQKNIKQFGLIKTGIPTDSGELTPVDRSMDTLILLAREGIGQVHCLKQEAHGFSRGRMSPILGIKNWT